MDGTLNKGEIYQFKKQLEYNRGDIIAIRYYDKNYKLEKTSIFRIAGIPGDSVSFNKGLPYVNDVKVYLPKTSKRIYLIKTGITNAAELNKGFQILYQNSDSILLNLTFFDQESIKTKFNIQEYFLNKTGWNPFNKFSDSINHDFFGPVYVAKTIKDLDSNNVLYNGDWGRFDKKSPVYFLIGDNVQETFDSRYIGLVSRDYILGKLLPKPKNLSH